MSTMKKNIIYIFVIVVALALIAFTLMNNKQENQAKTDIVAQKNASVAVKVDTVKTETSSLNFTANGNFEPFKELDFSAEKPGRVVRVLVEEGDHVRVGQTLAIVRSEQVSAELHAAEAAYQNGSGNANVRNCRCLETETKGYGQRVPSDQFKSWRPGKCESQCFT